MSTYYEQRRTPVTALVMYDALERAWVANFGDFPKRESLLVLLAQWAIETGRGAGMHNFNVGNVKSVAGDGHDFTFFTCNEIMGIVAAHHAVLASPLAEIEWESQERMVASVLFHPAHPACRFRAFETLEAGVIDHLAFLARKFKTSWAAVVAGDPALFAHLLKLNGYYTGDEDNGHGGGYGPNMRALFREFSHLGEESTQADLETVIGVQRALTALGFDVGPADGVAGTRTRAAVLTFQAAQGLVQDGVVGPSTRAALASCLAASVHP